MVREINCAVIVSSKRKLGACQTCVCRLPQTWVIKPLFTIKKKIKNQYKINPRNPWAARMAHFSRGKGERWKKNRNKTLLKEKENKKVADCDRPSDFFQNKSSLVNLISVWWSRSWRTQNFLDFQKRSILSKVMTILCSNSFLKRPSQIFPTGQS